MRSEGEPYLRSTPLKLSLSLIQALQSPEPSGLQTPPLQASVSVPFRWEDEPGKPRFTCAAITTLSKTLELPPRLLIVDAKRAKLEGSHLGRKKSLARKELYGYGGCLSPQRGQLGAMVLRKKEVKERGLFGLSGRKALKGEREVFEGSIDSATMAESSGSKLKMTKTKRNGKLSSLYHIKSHIWGVIYQGLKEVVPWRKRK